jgi:Family of unknown function (DUF6604)
LFSHHTAFNQISWYRDDLLLLESDIIEHHKIGTPGRHKMSTIDPSLFDTYRQYKAGTTKVTTWLAKKARELNTCGDLLSNTGETKGNGRLKVKARAAQKSAPKEEKYQIPLSSIPRIAQAIASLKDQQVPATIIRTLEDVIAARNACNACFEWVPFLPKTAKFLTGR